MKKRTEKSQKKLSRVHYLLLALVVLGVFGVCFFTVFQPYQLHADSKDPITRGVADKIEQLPLTKRTENPKATLGSAENPFLILEIVPYEEYAEFGYHIKGCEPVDVENMYGREALNTVQSVGASTVTQRGAVYYFPDEPEGNPKNYDGTSGVYNEKYGTEYKGYYERVEDGTGSFVQNKDGTIEKSSKGNIIWHTINSFEEENYANQTFVDAETTELTEDAESTETMQPSEDAENTDAAQSSEDGENTDTAQPSEDGENTDTAQPSDEEDNTNEVQLSEDGERIYTKQLKEIGDRIYTTRKHTKEDPINKLQNYYSYENHEDFLTDTLGLSQEDAENYCVIVKTITPDELNKNPEWVTYANMFSVSPKSHMEGLLDVWKKYNRLNHKSTVTNYENSFVKNDIAWKIVEMIYKRVTATKNYAVMVMDDGVYNFGDEMKGSTKDVTFDVYDWNLKKTDRTYSGTGSNNNFYKLAVMLLCMDSDLFQKLYLSGDKPVIQNGKNTLQTGDAAEYWHSNCFLLTDPNGDLSTSGNDYLYWTSDSSWENYGISGNLTMESNKPWVKDHVYTYKGDNSLTFNYLTDGSAKADKRFDEFNQYVENKYKNIDENHKATASDAIRFIIGDGTKSTTTEKKKLEGTLNILDIEPCVDMAEGFTLTENYIRMMVPKFTGEINITHMTTAQFIGMSEDLNSTYNMIFLGLDCGAYNTKKQSVAVTNIAGGTDWIEKELPDWNDYAMDKKIYVHTGDVMTGAEYVRDDKSHNRSVQFLWSSVKKYVIYNTSLRFPGNDITKLKRAELEDFAKAGYPIVAVPYLYDTNETMIDQTSVICKFVKANRVASTKTTESESQANGVYSVSDTNGITNAIADLTGTEVSFTKLPEDYSGKTNSKDEIENPNYLPKNSSGQSRMEFKFSVKNAKNKQFAYRIYIDQNQDGKFSSDEVFYKSKAFTADGSEIHYTCNLSNLLVGVIPWKLEIYETGNESSRIVKTGYSAARSTTENKKKINVLQIMPKADSESYDGKLNLATSDLFKKYYKALDDYEIEITAISLADFEQMFKEDSEANGGKHFTFDSAKDISFEDDSTKNPLNYSSKLGKELEDKYNMFIFGFGDAYGKQNISNEYGAVDYVKYFIAEGKSVLFTHDMSSMYNTNSTDFGYTVNTLFRDVMGMNRYQAVSKNLSDSEREELLRYQNQKSYDTVNDVWGNDLEQKQGFTYYALKRLGWPASNTSQKVPYKYMITNTKGEAVCTSSKNNAQVTGFNNANDLSTKVGQMNTGQITEYPYKIDKEFTVSKTHSQWYQLNMEDPEVTVWYTLLDDGNTTTFSADDKGDGTAATYGVSPYDAANNYYIYSKGNVFYSGVGHSTVNKEMEAKLFINTMIAAYRASYESPMVEVLNEEAELTDMEDVTYQLAVAQEFDAVAATAEGKNQIEAEKFSDEDTVTVCFSPIELNALTAKLDCKLYYMDGEEKIYIDTIYYKENGEKITLKTNEKNKYYFENLDNMQEYYFEYPKKYLNEWTDKDGKTHDAILQMQFEVKDDKAKKPGYTTLNLSVQQLFQLD